MIFDLITIALAGSFFGLAIYAVVRFLGKFPRRTVEDVAPYLRPMELQDLEAMLDPAGEVNFRLRLSRHEFSQLQRRRIHLAREYLLRMSHNAQVLVEWGNTEWIGSQGAPESFGRKDVLAGELVQAATEFRLYSLLALVKLKIWIIFRLDAWPLPSVPYLAALSSIAGIEAIHAYARLKSAAARLVQVYDDRYQQELVARL